MPTPQLILPRADVACGKMFFADRRTADGHRIALEVWNRATGRVREGYRLAAYRCKRCGGFHIGHRPVEQLSKRSVPEARQGFDRDGERPFDDWGDEAPRVRRVSLADSACS
jgi:hypothetical protein